MGLGYVPTPKMKNFMELNSIPFVIGLHFPRKIITLGGYDEDLAKVVL